MMFEPHPSQEETNSNETGGDFDELLAAAQPRLRGYVASILGGWSDVDDLVQETNIVLLMKRDSFTLGTNFIAWAFRVAYFKSTTWRRDRLREGRAMFNETAFQQIAAMAQEHFETSGDIHDALENCVKLLPEPDRKLVHLKYVERKSLMDHAATMGRNAAAIRKQLSRIRLVLRNCIDQGPRGSKSAF